MLVCLVLYLPEYGGVLQLDGTRRMEWKVSESTKDTSGQIRGINNVDADILKRYLDSRDVRTGEDGNIWSGTVMDQT